MSKSEEELITNSAQLVDYISKSPHDRAFKLIMRHREVSVPYLRSKLPPSLAERGHWDDLEFVPTDFLDKNFREQRSDLLLKLPYGKTESCYIHLLFEHQRAHDSTMPWRLLKYMVSIWTNIEHERRSLWNEQREQGISASERINIYPLPSIFPIVLYNGKETWTTSKSLAKSGLFDIAHGMKPFFPEFQHELTDLCQMREEDFEQYKEFTHCYHILKFKSHTHAGEIVPALESMIDYLQWLKDINPDLARILFTLSFYVEGKNIKIQQQIAQILEEKINIGEDMPILLEEIRKEGRKEGKNEGLKEGIQQEKYQNAKNFLALGVAIETISKATGLTVEEIEKLRE